MQRSSAVRQQGDPKSASREQSSRQTRRLAASRKTKFGGVRARICAPSCSSGRDFHFSVQSGSTVVASYSTKRGNRCRETAARDAEARCGPRAGEAKHLALQQALQRIDGLKALTANAIRGAPRAAQSVWSWRERRRHSDEINAAGTRGFICDLVRLTARGRSRCPVRGSCRQAPCLPPPAKVEWCPPSGRRR
jgi:hypothetical protein